MAPRPKLRETLAGACKRRVRHLKRRAPTGSRTRTRSRTWTRTPRTTAGTSSVRVTLSKQDLARASGGTPARRRPALLDDLLRCNRFRVSFAHEIPRSPVCHGMPPAGPFSRCDYRPTVPHITPGLPLSPGGILHDVDADTWLH